ncbi:PepSY-associated TM helix domain-containing protein [Piscinibacter sp.]|uniref:PepSY-associated TM helix domain-containing protein n=1 Tax=Piscinibacter sp. TaxID=1903157 RepID=UPI0039E6BC5A
MNIRSDIVKVYKDVHTWVGIVCGLLLFIGFYAGAITMFEKPLQRWATPPTALAAAPPLEEAEKLLAAVRDEQPRPIDRYGIVVDITPEQPARVTWSLPGKSEFDRIEYGASFAPDGSLQTERLRRAQVAQLVDRLHQFVGLPLPEHIARPLMGAVALAYAVALLSGLIVLLPALVRDLFALRIGPNLKRMWLDVHNALGVFSLPFHLVIALTCVVFAFHAPFYLAQSKAFYGGQINWGQPSTMPAGGTPMRAHQLLARVREQLPGFDVHRFGFEQESIFRQDATVQGLDVRRGTRGSTWMRTRIDPITGDVDLRGLPGHMDGWSEAVNTFFMLHFGSFGGTPVRWLYALMGLAGAALFYTGNLLWIESRRKPRRGAETVVQARSARMMGCLTVGVALGSVAGISATIAATKWLPVRVADPGFWHEAIYCGVFLAATAWAFVRGAAKGAHELLWLCAAATAAIPLVSLMSAWGMVGGWNHPGTVAVDLTALAAVPVFAWLIRLTRRRIHHGRADSVWAVRTAQARRP